MTKPKPTRTPPWDARPYVATPRAAALDARLSFEARGVLWYALSLPPGSELDLAAVCSQGLGRDKGRRIFRELRQAGYLLALTERDDAGRITRRSYQISEQAFQNSQETGVGSPAHAASAHARAASAHAPAYARAANMRDSHAPNQDPTRNMFPESLDKNLDSNTKTPDHDHEYIYIYTHDPNTKDSGSRESRVSRDSRTDSQVDHASLPRKKNHPFPEGETREARNKFDPESETVETWGKQHTNLAPLGITIGQETNTEHKPRPDDPDTSGKLETDFQAQAPRKHTTSGKNRTTKPRPLAPENPSQAPGLGPENPSQGRPTLSGATQGTDFQGQADPGAQGMLPGFTPEPTKRKKARQKKHSTQVSEAFQEAVTDAGLRVIMRGASEAIAKVLELETNPDEVRAAVTAALADMPNMQFYHVDRLANDIRTYRARQAAKQSETVYTNEFSARYQAQVAQELGLVDAPDWMDELLFGDD